MASSSFSSNSECDDCIRCNLSLPREPPYYPIPGQPQVVYYAKVLRNRNPGTGKTPEKRPNCFSKAFTWYTKARHPKCKNEPSTNSDDAAPQDDLVGFASWLDAKYAEFLRENGIESDNDERKMTQTVSAPYTINLKECDKPKRSDRCKSSRQKPQNPAGNSSDAGDSVNKEVTCSHKSNTTIKSVDSPSTRTTKTQSVSSICCPGGALTNDDLKVKPKKRIKLKKSTIDIECECDIVSTKSVNAKPSVPTNVKKKPATADVICECVDLIPKKPTANVNCGNSNLKLDLKSNTCECTKAHITTGAECQTDHNYDACVKSFVSFMGKSTPVCLCCDKSTPMLDKSCQTDVGSCSTCPMCCPCEGVVLEQYSTTAVQEPESRLVKIQEPELRLETMRTHRVFTQQGCQTEDFPISEDIMVNNSREYPLFMKILCLSKFSHARVG